MIKLWTINRVLRWTGFRLFIDVDCDDGPDRRPTLIGFKWVGLPGSAGWRGMLPVTRFMCDACGDTGRVINRGGELGRLRDSDSTRVTATRDGDTWITREGEVCPCPRCVAALPEAVHDEVTAPIDAEEPRA